MKDRKIKIARSSFKRKSVFILLSSQTLTYYSRLGWAGLLILVEAHKLLVSRATIYYYDFVEELFSNECNSSYNPYFRRVGVHAYSSFIMFKNI